jgi:hypothetical protein
MRALNPEETKTLSTAIEFAGTSCGFYAKITRDDPRGPEYGTYEVEADENFGMVRVVYHARTRDDFTMLFETPEDFKRWAKSL